MTVSAIIPVYNHSKFLKQRIDSVLNQTYKDFELIILDDCSEDNSRDIINEYQSRFSQIKTIFRDSNSGSPFSQWNLGVSHAKGDYIWIAESDDSADPLFLEKSIRVMLDFESVGLVHCDSKVIDEQNGIEYLISEKRKASGKMRWTNYGSCAGKMEISNHFFLENSICNVSSVLFRKSRFLQAGGADPAMKFCGDWLLYLRILLISDFAYIPIPLNIFRIHSGSTFHSYYRSNTFLTETLKVYSFVVRNIKLTLQKKLSIVKKIVIFFLLRGFVFLRLDTLLRIDIGRLKYKTA